MPIELPQDIIDRVQQRAAAGKGVSEADVIRRALDTLDWQDRERLAVQEGIDASRRGDVQDLGVFDSEFRVANKIAADA